MIECHYQASHKTTQNGVWFPWISLKGNTVYKKQKRDYLICPRLKWPPSIERPAVFRAQTQPLCLGWDVPGAREMTSQSITRRQLPCQRQGRNAACWLCSAACRVSINSGGVSEWQPKWHIWGMRGTWLLNRLVGRGRLPAHSARWRSGQASVTHLALHLGVQEAAARRQVISWVERRRILSLPWGAPGDGES